MGILFLLAFTIRISNGSASLIVGLGLVLLGFGIPVSMGWAILFCPAVLIVLIMFGLIGILLVVKGILSFMGEKGEAANEKLDKKSGEVMMDILLKFIDIVSGRK